MLVLFPVFDHFPFCKIYDAFLVPFTFFRIASCDQIWGLEEQLQNLSFSAFTSRSVRSMHPNFPTSGVTKWKFKKKNRSTLMNTTDWLKLRYFVFLQHLRNRKKKLPRWNQIIIYNCNFNSTNGCIFCHCTFLELCYYTSHGAVQIPIVQTTHSATLKSDVWVTTTTSQPYLTSTDFLLILYWVK